MSKTQEKKLKRKRRLEAKRKHDIDQAAFFYEGNKFKADRYVPLMYSIESWLCTIDEAMRLRRQRGLDSELIEAAYRGAIISLRREGLRPVASGPFDYSTPALLKAGLIQGVLGIAFIGHEHDGYSVSEVLGVIRTLNWSRVTWNQIRMDADRGYLDFLLENIGPDSKTAERLAYRLGVQETNPS